MGDVQLGRPLAHGRTADVYAWGDAHVLKLFHSWFGLESIEYEARIARAVHASGLPVPAVGDIIQVDGHTGLVYERVVGHPMLDALTHDSSQITEYAQRLASLHAEMHECVADAELPLQRQRLEDKIGNAGALTRPLRYAALAALDGMPDGDRLCHGDFHPGNVLLTAQGEVIIDWIDATRGNPLADVARTTILAMGSAEGDDRTTPVMRSLAREFHANYIRHYFSLGPPGMAEYRRWLPIVAAARLSENIRELEAWLLAEARKIE